MTRNLTALCFDMSRLSVTDESIWLPMIPAGIFSGRDGRAWNNSNPDAVVAAFDQKLPFDVEHATEMGWGNTSAIGWLLELQNRAGEIWARVEWNAEGREKIEEKKYGFYSPAFLTDALGNVLAMSSAGLTNKPNLSVPALNREETPMPLPVELTQALGLGADADTASALTAINTLKADHQLAMNRAAAGPDLTKFVPKETYELALNRATTAETKVQQTEEARLSALVDDAIAAGKVAPANKEMFLGMCRAEGGEEKFNAFVASAPVIADASQVKTTEQQTGELSKDELAMCRMMGVKPETWKATKAAQKAQ